METMQSEEHRAKMKFANLRELQNTMRYSQVGFTEVLEERNQEHGKTIW